MSFGLRVTAAVLVFLGVVLAVRTFQHPPVIVIQRGYRGLGMVELYSPAAVKQALAVNKVPAPEDAQSPAGQPASAAYQNVQVLGDVDANEFLRLMAAITNWVAPNEGCTYCHTDNLAEDKLYTKVVARRMLQMVRHINGDWKSHVAGTGVTCYTCHRGQPVPSNIWFADPAAGRTNGLAQVQPGKNHPSIVAGSAALPVDPLSTFLDGSNEIRVVSSTALPQNDRQSIKQAEWTYALMMHFSQSLGVNCTYCHNSRSFFDWDQSTPQRATAWYGIRMVRDLNLAYLDPLKVSLPANRLGPAGDGPKVNCATCHNGVYKPLFGVSMLKDYPELAAAHDAAPAPGSTPPAVPTSAPGTTPSKP